jgi:hypothetical protein
MKVMSKKTKLSREDIFEKARNSFEGKLGLTGNGTEDKCCIEFSSDIGFVTVQVVESEDENEVILTTREWEYQIERFLLNL